MLRSSWRDALRFALYVVYCFEGGAFLLLVPWTDLWQQIFFFRRLPWLGAIGGSAVVRGAVSGTGAALLVMGLVDLGSAIAGWLRRPAARAPR